MKNCECDKWCYCSRKSIQKKIDKIPFYDADMAITDIKREMKRQSSHLYNSQIYNFIKDIL